MQVSPRASLQDEREMDQTDGTSVEEAERTVLRKQARRFVTCYDYGLYPSLSCIILGRSYSIPLRVRVLICKVGMKKSTHFVGLLWGLNEMIQIKLSAWCLLHSTGLIQVRHCGCYCHYDFSQRPPPMTFAHWLILTCLPEPQRTNLVPLCPRQSFWDSNVSFTSPLSLPLLFRLIIPTFFQAFWMKGDFSNCASL